MSDTLPPPPPETDPIGLKRRNAQRLLALGYISDEDYEAIGQRHGFVSAPKPPRTAGAKALTAVSVTGYILLALGAVAEIAATRNPALRGPLEGLLEVASILGQLIQ